MAADSWETPDLLFQHLDQIYQFDLDVAADENNRKCHRFFDEKANGLAQSWGEYTCWCNPPYSKPLPWVIKASTAAQMGATVVMLLPVDTSTKWFEWCYETASEIILLTPRVRFVGAIGSPRWANMIVVWQPRMAGLTVAAPIMGLWRWKEEENGYGDVSVAGDKGVGDGKAEGCGSGEAEEVE